MDRGDFSNTDLPTPFKCILSDCNEPITIATIITHCMTAHHVDFQEVESKEKISMFVATSENYLEYGKNVCLGSVGLKLRKTKENHYPEYYPNPLPILIMACRNNYQRVFGKKKDFSLNADFLSFWIVMPEMKVPKLSAIITVYDDDQIFSLSASVKVRSITSNQEIEKFAHTETNQLIINNGMLNKLSKDDAIFLEIILNESLL